MQCTACHTAEKHQMLGKSYSVSSMNRDRVACESCHGALPHDTDVLNNHTLKVACQSCHIPIYAKEVREDEVGGTRRSNARWCAIQGSR